MQLTTLQSRSLQKGLIALGVLVVWGGSVGESVAECGDYVVMMGSVHQDSPVAEVDSRHLLPARTASLSLPVMDSTDWRFLMPLSGESKSPTAPCNSWSCRQKDSVKLPPVSGSLRSFSELPVNRDESSFDLRPASGAGFPHCRKLGRTSEGYLFELEKPPQFSS
jgi:hypothetical protein